MRPRVDQLEHSADYECVESIQHGSLHSWLRPHLFTLRPVAASYWVLNLAVLLFVLVVWRRSGIGWADAVPTICMGMVGGFLILLPIHEHIHAIAYRLVGVRHVQVRYDLRRATALCVAPGEVLEAGSFILVCLAPLAILNPLLAVGTILVPGGAVALALAGALLMHTGACSGDVAFVQYVRSWRPHHLFTFDDRRLPLTYFYRARTNAGAVASERANTPSAHLAPGRLARFVGSGALAGVLSTLVFTVVHQLLISSIWFALLPMALAGALCGMCLAWSYAVVIPAATLGNWFQYNSVYLAMFVALGISSLATFEPVTTIAALLEAGQPPNQLIGRALPMTGVFTLVTAATLSRLYRVSWRGAVGILVTTAVLVLLLGLNISTLGLVAVPRAESGVLAEVFGLLLTIFGAFAAIVVLLERHRFQRTG